MSWVKDCDGFVDSLSIVTEAEEEMWDFDERLMVGSVVASL